MLHLRRKISSNMAKLPLFERTGTVYSNRIWIYNTAKVTSRKSIGLSSKPCSKTIEGKWNDWKRPRLFVYVLLLTPAD